MYLANFEMTAEEQRRLPLQTNGCEPHAGVYDVQAGVVADAGPLVLCHNWKLACLYCGAAFADVCPRGCSCVNIWILQVAVKTVRPGVPEKDKAEFVGEAALQATLKHQNIAALLGVCMTQKPYLAILELVLYASHRLSPSAVWHPAQEPFFCLLRYRWGC